MRALHRRCSGAHAGLEPAQRSWGGIEGEKLQPPWIDVIVPEGRFRKTLLRDFPSAEDRPARLPGVVPAEVKGG